jgi:uncharacterized protein (TIGR02996 family)
MTDATLAALLRDVLDAPDDDGARLRYADRLDELGDPERAEFIRVQCRRSSEEEEIERRGWSRQEEDIRLACLRRREGELHQGRWQKWVGLPLPFVARRDVHFHFRRGFVKEVTLTAADWLTHADAILAAHPVREVRLTELNYHPDAANFRLSRAEYGIWISHRYPGVTFYLPATTQGGAFIVPEHLAPAIEALAQQGVNL